MSTKKEVIQAITQNLAKHLATEFDGHWEERFQKVLDSFDWVGTSCLGKAGMDEPVFVLRARDPLFRETVNAWAIAARRDGVHEHEKINQAVQQAYQGELWKKQMIEDEFARERMADEQGSDV